MRLRSAFIALPLLLGLAACADVPAGTDQPKPKAAPVVTAPAPQKASRPAAVLTSKNFMPAMNKASAKYKTWKSTLRMVAGKEVSTLTIVQTTDPAAMLMDLNGKLVGGKGRIIVVKGVAYVSVAGATPAGKYLKVNPKNRKDPLAPLLGQLVDAGDPVKAFKNFNEGFVSVRFVGRETLTGRQLNRYAMTVNSDVVYAAMNLPRPAGMPKFMTYNIWMDANHLVHRATYTMAGVSTELTMSDYGKPVSIKAPPARDIVKR